MKWTKKNVLEKLSNLDKKLGRRPTKRDNNSLYVLSRRVFGSWNKMMSMAGYLCKDFQKPIIPNRLTCSLAYLLGLLCTDGHLQALKNESKYKVMFYTSEIDEVEIIKKLIKLNFNYNASVRARKSTLSDRPNYEIYISSKGVCEFFHKLGVPYGAKSYDIRVPKIFANYKSRKLWSYLRGVFDGDGSIIFSGAVSSFKISSGSRLFIDDIQKIMQGNDFLNSYISRQNQNVWEIRINRKADLKRLYCLLYKDAEFFYPRKKSKWEINMFKNASAIF